MNYSGGGVTISRGEALFQPHFVTSIFKRCLTLGIHTGLDSSGYCDLQAAKPVLEFTELVLLDIKSFAPATYRNVTSLELEPTLILARYLSKINKPTWIRFVLVPGLTGDHKFNCQPAVPQKTKLRARYKADSIAGRQSQKKIIILFAKGMQKMCKSTC